MANWMSQNGSLLLLAAESEGPSNSLYIHLGAAAAVAAASLL